MAAGRTGTVQIQTGNNRVSWGRPAASATVVAQAGADATIFTIAAGATLANGQPAAGCRLTFPLFNNAPTAFTANGWALFDAAAAWAADGCADDDPPPPPDGVEHVVLVSVDGLNPAAITQLGPSGAPTFYRLLAEGASTLERSDHGRAHADAAEPLVDGHRPQGRPARRARRDVQRGPGHDDPHRGRAVRGIGVRRRARQRRCDRAVRGQGEVRLLRPQLGGDHRRPGHHRRRQRPGQDRLLPASFVQRNHDRAPR